MRKCRKSLEDKRRAVASAQDPNPEIRALSPPIFTHEKRTQRAIVAPESTLPQENLRPENAFTVRGLPRSPSNSAVHPPISNPHSGRLEIAATHSKQTTAPISNRHFFRGNGAQNSADSWFQAFRYHGTFTKMIRWFPFSKRSAFKISARSFCRK